MLRLVNNNADANDTALDLRVQPGETPMTIDSSTKAADLNADNLDGGDATGFVSSGIYKRESAVVAGTQIGVGTFVAEQACDFGDVLLSGGQANVDSTSVMLESLPTPGSTTSRKVRINKNGATYNWNVVVLCADQWERRQAGNARWTTLPTPSMPSPGDASGLAQHWFIEYGL